MRTARYTHVQKNNVKNKIKSANIAHSCLTAILVSFVTFLCVFSSSLYRQRETYIHTMCKDGNGSYVEIEIL